jgi:hypothetical protein
VDATVGTSMLWGLTLGCFAAALALAAHLVALTGPALLWPVALGFLLAIFYSADPLALKYVGLGDATIFATFGPLLMLGVSGVVTGAPLTLAQLYAAALGSGGWAALGAHGPVLAMSLPIGLLTVNILHANNVRDIPLDKEAGAHTLAQVLGVEGSQSLYYANFGAAYASALFALALRLCTVYGVDMGQAVGALAALPLADLLTLVSGAEGAAGLAAVGGPLAAALHFLRGAAVIVIVTAPWAVALCGRMARLELATLPQSTAQFDLLFGACIVSALLPARDMARLWLGILFYLGGVNNVLMWHHTAQLVRYKLGAATGLGPAFPAVLASALAAVASGTQMAASAVFILGVPGYTRPAALVLLAFLVPVTPVVHDMWNAGHEAAAEVRDPRATSARAYRAAMGAPVEPSTAAPVPASGRKRRGSTRGGPAPFLLHVGGPSSSPAHVHSFLDPFSNEFVHFFKNCMGAGGLLVALAYTDM